MGLRRSCARGVSLVSTLALKHIFKRPAANMPGKLALKVDPHIIDLAHDKLSEGSLVVVGTNGKTTVTNLLADSLETCGKRVMCNRTGANMAGGIASCILQNPASDWAVLESDELWLQRSLADLRPQAVLLLNLFRDQLDRCGEIATIQDSIVTALQSSPQTTLIYNADDPLCQRIAQQLSNPKLTFGVADSMNLKQNRVADAQMCQGCQNIVEYDFIQYGQLGNYHCSHCGFKRPALDFEARNIGLSPDGVRFDVYQTADNCCLGAVTSKLPGAYMVYNLLAAFVGAHIAQVSAQDFQTALDGFAPNNGRLQFFDIETHHTLLNLAKNPTGFNQNLRLIPDNLGPGASIAFFINDKEADGHDISWIWDIDFEELAHKGSAQIFAGGLRKEDLAVRLKYAGLSPKLVHNAQEVLVATHAHEPVYIISNYTHLQELRYELERLSAKGGTNHGA